MPAQMPSSFAAAAGQGFTRESRGGGKSDGRGSGDWARKDGRTSANGTLTLRRSTNPLGLVSAPGETSIQHQPESLEQQQLNFEQPHDFRYSKQDLLDIYKHKQESGEDNGANVSNLYAEGWAPDQYHGSAIQSGWGKASDGRDYFAPNFCWNIHGDTHPVGLEEMSDQEKRLFNGDINSHLKPHPSQNTKDSISNVRKTPASHSQNYSNLSPVASRPSARRIQTSDTTTTGLASPNDINKIPRDESSSFFARKTESKYGIDERLDEAKSNQTIEGLMRANPPGGALGSGQTSPWGASTNTALAPMGAFANSPFSPPMNPPTPSDKRPVPPRSGSRFFQSSTKENSEDLSKPAEKSWRPRQRTDTDPFADEVPCGSAALGGDSGGNSHQRPLGSDTPVRGSSSDFGMSEVPGFRDAFQREQSHNTPRPVNGQTEPLSPSDTNPYRSPAGPPDDRQQQSDEGYHTESHAPDRSQCLGGIGDNNQTAFGNIPRGFPGIAFDGSDRSQTSSTTGSRTQLGGLPSLGAIGGLGGWLNTNGNPIGTPDREIRPGFPSAFGSTLFSPMGETQGHANITGGFGPTTVGNTPVSATSGRGSKLGSLFPPAMQAQMLTTESDVSGDGETRQGSAFGAIARNAFPPPRDNESPLRASRHAFDELFPQIDTTRSAAALPASENSQAPTNSPFATSSQHNYQQSQASSDSTVNQQLPTAQQRMMVMPDRMRWVYLDPQAQVQGPFSGLEMHDWYKASFFTPDLSVKKLEDVDFEPLGQLIRRIGNSREPFLVPQIGIPHGQPSTQPGAAFTPPAAGHGPGLAQPGVVQPPFANSFPSFGTTLTAEQQNNLERRKQEEQYLMARQREFLAQQQVNMKQMQISGIPSALHHSSVHNLQSQPSYASISTPIGLTPQPSVPTGPAFFDSISRQLPAGVLPGECYRDEDISRLTLRDRHGFFNAPAVVGPPSQPQQIGSVISQSNAQNQSPRIDDIDFAARLREFEQLQEQHEIEELGQAQVAPQKSDDSIDTPQPLQQIQPCGPSVLPPKAGEPEIPAPDSLSMTQRVQKAATAKQSQISPVQPDSPWAKFNPNLPMPFPPPQSTAPLPAPTAQRGRASLPETLDMQDRSRSRTPELKSATPSIAPWAKEPVDAPKALSLREIQEAEAKKAAKAEEIAIAARRATYEQELKMLASQPAAPAPGLPTTATWGSNTSPTNSTPAKSAWAKPALTKAKAPSSKQKTLADIQREEELRKQKLAAVAATQSHVGGVGGKRCADILSNTASNTSPVGGPAWSTVGAGGKVKFPTGPAASSQLPAARSASAHSVTLPIRLNSKPAASVRSAATQAANNVGAARDEFTKWAKATLDKGLNPGINGSFPSEPSIIADSIYSHSQTMNGNDFAMEFIRRRNNAEKGIIELVTSGSGNAFSNSSDRSGGWSEVPKKGPLKEEPTAGFKVVPSKKKGKK